MMIVATILNTLETWWDHLGVIFTGLLVLVGFVGTLFALRTLRAIERQTEALVEGQRPKIIAVGHGDPTKTLADRSARRVEIELENKGTIPAYDLTYESWIEILPFPFQDFTPQASYFKCPAPMTLYGNSQPMILNIPTQNEVTPEQIQAVVNLALYVCVRVHVTYRDAFGKRYSNFGYYVQKQGFGFLPKYNDSN